MNSISQLRQNAATTVAAVKERFENVRSLDQNPLFDTDDRVGHVSASADNWTSVASFEPSGAPLSFQWKSSDPNKQAEGELDASVIEDIQSIEHKDGTTTFTQQHYGPSAYGIGEYSNGTIAILDSKTAELIDAKGW